MFKVHVFLVSSDNTENRIDTLSLKFPMIQLTACANPIPVL